MEVEEEKIYEDVDCVKDDGKWKCKLYTEPMFIPLSPAEIPRIKIKTPESEFEVEPGGGGKVNPNRKYDEANDIEEIQVYNAWVTEIDEDRFSIISSIKRIMHCKVYTGYNNKKILRCDCEEPVEVV